MLYDPEWMLANLDDMIEFCIANSMRKSGEALKAARRRCELEVRSRRPKVKLKPMKMTG